MNKELKSRPPTLPILGPDELTIALSPNQIATVYSDLLENVYEGRSDRINGHPIEKFQKGIEQDVLFPFLVFDGDKPVACYAIQWLGEKVDMGSAVVLPEYRNTGLVRGKEIYLKAHDWAENKLGPKTAIIMGGSRIPVSAAISVNYCNRFPNWLTPFASWGYQSEPLEENNNRVHEFLLVSESYPRGGAYAPNTIYVPDDVRVAEQIKQLWQRFTVWNKSSNKINFSSNNEKEVPPPTFLYDWSDTEMAEFELDQQMNPKAMSLEDVINKSFSGTQDAEVPKTRGVSLDIPVESQQSTSIQNTLLKKGFVFCGINPGILPIEVSYPDGRKGIFWRNPSNIYGFLRPGLKNNIQYAGLPTLNDETLENVFKEIQLAWMS